jgi:hypothetical protein
LLPIDWKEEFWTCYNRFMFENVMGKGVKIAWVN